LSAGGVDVFSTGTAEAGVDAVFFEVLHEFFDCFVVRFGEERLIDGVIFNNIDQIGGHAAVEPYEFIGVLAAVIEILKQNIFESDLVAGLLIEIIQCVDEGGDVVGLVDGHDLITLGIIGSVQ